MASLAEIRAKLAEQQNRSTGNSTGGGDNAIYPHWNMQEGKEAVVRFLPDGNADKVEQVPPSRAFSKVKPWRYGSVVVKKASQEGHRKA